MLDTYYTVLGISETATQKEIKAAYRELMKQVHPDAVPKASPYWKQQAEEKSKEVTRRTAYCRTPCSVPCMIGT